MMMIVVHYFVLTVKSGSICSFRGGKRHGKGILTFDDGSVCDGIWKEDFFCSGSRTYESRTSRRLIYEGSLTKDQTGWTDVSSSHMHGQGKLTYKGGLLYEGIWEKGYLYQGNMKSGLCDGEGTLVCPDGVYKGCFQEGKRHGPGTFAFDNGNTYEGTWKEGKEDGQGTRTYAYDGAYEGMWKEGKEDGQGTRTYANGTTYKGTWKEGKEDGQGTRTYAKGITYKGMWKKGKEDGQGTRKYANGSVYFMWKEGMQNGQGKHVSKITKVSKEGTFKNGFYKG